MLTSGSRLGPYEILAPLGAGGMGEVYRARDTRLGRDVALKFLPADFAADPERHARLEREARLLASLNHPNIAVLYGLEHLDGQHALVMELVEGEGLDERIARAAVPLDEALPIALQIAEALEAAHEKGIVHRDLKPANVKVRPDGTVKVLDFGLAKAWEEQVEGSDAAHSPTITGHHTRAGVILGTAAYMSPEQARGKPVDRRADIWAFGCVLYEMLTGQRLFQGETVSDTLAAVLRQDVELSAVPGVTPAPVRALLERCLQRDPRQRLRDVGEARITLGGPMSALPGAPPGRDALTGAARTTPRRWRAWLAPVVACAAGAALGALIFRANPVAPVVRASLPPPAGAEYYLGSRQPGPVSISPDGSRIVFAAHDGEHGLRLWLRRLDTGEAAPLAGTDNGSYPFWSPNGRSIGFFADGKLKRMDLSGGAVMALCGAPFGKGGSWNERGTIVFAPTYNCPLLRIGAQGGATVSVTRLDEAKHENSHRFPQFLPDGEHFLFLTRVSGEAGRATNRVMVGSLDGGETKSLLATDTNVAFASGFLLYVRDRVLLARRLNPRSLRFEGDEFPVAANVGVIPAAALAVFSASATGVLVYGVSSGGTVARLDWLDRQGNVVGTIGPPGTYEELAFAPDGRHLAATMQDPASGEDDVWVLDTERGIPVRLTSNRPLSSGPVWLADSRSLVFRSRDSGSLDLYRRAIGGESDADLVLASDGDKQATSVSPDGKFLAYRLARKDTGMDVWILPLASGGKPYPFLHSRFDEEEARFSTDGRWLAFQSNETGRQEIYVTSFPQPGERLRVSSNGGVLPRWSRDGRELFYRSEDLVNLMAVQVTPEEGSIGLGTPVRLFSVPHAMTGPYETYNGRFLFIIDEPIHDRAPLNLVVNWTTLAQGGSG